VSAERSALAAGASGQPPRRHTEPPGGEWGLGSTAPQAFIVFYLQNLAPRERPPATALFIPAAEIDIKAALLHIQIIAGKEIATFEVGRI